MSHVRAVAVWAACVPAALAAPPSLSPDADEAVVRRLIDALKDPDEEVRQNVATALAKIGPGCVDALAAALKDTVPERRAGAAYALGLIGPPAKSALPALLDALADKERDVRRQASFSIGRLIPGRDAARPASPPLFRGGLQ